MANVALLADNQLNLPILEAGVAHFMLEKDWSVVMALCIYTYLHKFIKMRERIN